MAFYYIIWWQHKIQRVRASTLSISLKGQSHWYFSSLNSDAKTWFLSCLFSRKNGESSTTNQVIWGVGQNILNLFTVIQKSIPGLVMRNCANLGWQSCLHFNNCESSLAQSSAPSDPLQAESAEVVTESKLGCKLSEKRWKSLNAWYGLKWSLPIKLNPDCKFFFLVHFLLLLYFSSP